MITIISGTNRQDSNTTQICNYYLELLNEKSNEEIALIDLAQIPFKAYEGALYSAEDQSDTIYYLQEKFIIPSEKLVFIIPEYNGGMPGILKLFIDLVSVRDLKKSFFMKKACLTGVSSGRAGNLRGMDHLTGVLNYLQVVVFPNRLPISSIDSVMDNSEKLTDPDTLEAIEKQVTDFLVF